MQVPQILIPDNGSIIRLCSGKAEVIANVKTDALVVDGKQLLPLASKAIKDRNSSYITGQFFRPLFSMTPVRWTTGRYLSWGIGRNSSRFRSTSEALISDEIETLSPERL